MPTNEERRKIAQRLRILATHREVDKWYVEDAIGLYMGECIDGYDPVSVADLADLIEPEQERTCRNVCSSEGGFTCSECGAHISGGADYCHSFVNEDEIRVYTTANEPSWNFCPNCDARVIEEVNNA